MRRHLVVTLYVEVEVGPDELATDVADHVAVVMNGARKSDSVIQAADLLVSTAPRFVDVPQAQVEAGVKPLDRGR